MIPVNFTKLKAITIISTALLLSAASCQEDASEENVPMRQMSYQAASSEKTLSELLPQNFDKSAIRYQIDKPRYRLSVWYHNHEIKSFPVVFGFGYGPDKRQEGDGATPEGRFQIRNLYPHKSWTYFLWFDYPTAESWEKHRQSKEKGEIPADATVGGEVGIHGVPKGQEDLITRGENWTAGCIALSTAHISEIYAIAAVGQVIDIQ